MNQAWHQCFGDRSWAFLCPNGTIFNQVHPYEDDRSWCWGWWSKWEENAEPNYGILLWLILIRLKLWCEQYDDDHHYHFADHDPMMMPRSCLPVSGGSTLTASPRKAFMLSMRLSSAPLGKTSLTKKSHSYGPPLATPPASTDTEGFLSFVRFELKVGALSLI